LKAVIMAGGEGSRLRPLTCALPKPMVPILNRPCMEHTVYLLRQQGITEIAVTLQYLPEEIKSYFGNGSRYGVHLNYFIEDTPLGTAGSVKNASSFLDETFVVVSGDALTDCNLQEAVEFHRAKKALVTLVLTTVTCPLEYGVVITDEQGRIIRFLEKPGWGEVFSDTVNTGIYILEPEVLDFIKEQEMVDFSKDLYPQLLAERKPLYAYVTKGYWCDIGNVEQYQQAQFDILEKKGTLISLPGKEIYPGIWMEEGVRIDPSVELIPPVVIGDGTVIGPYSRVGPLTVIGRGVHVGQGASLKRCVLWDYSWIGDGVELRGCTVGKNARLLSACRAFEGSVIGDHTVVGEGSIIDPAVKIWPGKWIEKGTRLSSSLVWGNCSRTRLFGNMGISGEICTELTPDLVSRLGAAVGTNIKKGNFSLGSDGHPDSQLIKNAVLSGLMSTGLHVIDLGKVPLPVHRYGIRAFDLQGGVHINRMEGNKINIRLINNYGADYSRAEQRKVEGLLNREEYRFAAGEDILSPEYRPGIGRSYLNFLLQFLDRDLTRRNRMRLVVDYDSHQLGSLLPGFFDELGCEVHAVTNQQHYPQNISKLKKIAVQLGEVVEEQGAHFGAVVDSAGEMLVLVDDHGELVDEEKYLALFSLITARTNPGAILVLPATSPQAVIEMARAEGAEVRIAKTAPWALMAEFMKEEVLASQQHFPQFLFYNDALASMALLAQYLAKEGRPLSMILSELPGFAVARKEVGVMWEEKGKVLRHLAEASAGQKVETAEGLKIQHPQGWAMVLPDADEPVCRVYSEAFNQEIAESLTDMYVEKIKEISSTE